MGTVTSTQMENSDGVNGLYVWCNSVKWFRLMMFNATFSVKCDFEHFKYGIQNYKA